MENPRLLYSAWLLALIVVVSMSFNGKEGTSDFQGIADSREVIVNSERAVEIKKYHVLPGQSVQIGDRLVELNRPELTLKINEITHELEEVKNRHLFGVEEMRAKIRQLKAEETFKITEIDYKIRQLTSRHEFNRELATGLKSLQSDQGTDALRVGAGPIALEIESLKKERELTRNRIGVEINAIESLLSSPENVLSIRAQSLEKELALLRREQEALLIYSQIGGVIGSVHFKAGEKVSPFEPILTLYTKSPSYVKGYIHENLYNRIVLGDKVTVSSLTGKDTITPGEVIGVGSRIVAYPERLRKRAEIQIWGREVQVRIPEDNSFLLGERVMIQCEGCDTRFSWATIMRLWDAGISSAAESNVIGYPPGSRER